MNAAVAPSDLIAWLLLAGMAVGSFVWAATSGQFDDLDRASRLPLDDGTAERTQTGEGTGSPAGRSER